MREWEKLSDEDFIIHDSAAAFAVVILIELVGSGG